MKCRNCGSLLTLPLIDLGSAPPSNAYLSPENLRKPEQWFPLRVLVCEQCWLVQTEDFDHTIEPFGADYAYFSGFSTSWLKHAERYVAEMVVRFDLGPMSHVIELAANDGYLLQYVKARGIPCTGVEPTASTAAAAREKGIPIIEEFFGLRLATRLASDNTRANLLVANNVLAHVPDINDFVAGVAIILAPSGIATFEFPHLLKLIAENQFDTIYHEHFSYLSLTAVQTIFNQNGLTIFDLQEIPTHGGSLRVFAARADEPRERQASVSALLEREREAGVASASYYSGFQAKADRVKTDLLSFLIETKRHGKTVIGYGAAAKGNTLMNYAGIRPDLIPFVADRNPAKRGKYMPGSRIPIVSEECIGKRKPDFVLILPWNIRAEVVQQLEYIRSWGGRFVTAVPGFTVLP